MSKSLKIRIDNFELKGKSVKIKENGFKIKEIAGDDKFSAKNAISYYSSRAGGTVVKGGETVVKGIDRGIKSLLRTGKDRNDATKEISGWNDKVIGIKKSTRIKQHREFVVSNVKRGFKKKDKQLKASSAFSPFKSKRKKYVTAYRKARRARLGTFISNTRFSRLLSGKIANFTSKHRYIRNISKGLATAFKIGGKTVKLGLSVALSLIRMGSMLLLPVFMIVLIVFSTTMSRANNISKETILTPVTITGEIGSNRISGVISYQMWGKHQSISFSGDIKNGRFSYKNDDKKIELSGTVKGNEISLKGKIDGGDIYAKGNKNNRTFVLSGYYGDGASAAYKGKFLNPFGKVKHIITSGYGYRTVPFEHFHTGIDLCSPEGMNAKIYASAPGRARVPAFQHNGLGVHVIIEHGNGVQSVYGHLNGVAVKDGQYVSAWQLIGYEGSTGLSTGAHLHFEMRINGKHTDPTKYYKDVYNNAA